MDQVWSSRKRGFASAHLRTAFCRVSIGWGPKFSSVLSFCRWITLVISQGLSHLYIPVPGEVYWLFSRFLFSNTRQCRFLCTCNLVQPISLCVVFLLLIFRGFCTFSAWTNHNVIEAMLAMPKVQPKVPAQPPASGVGRASPGETGQEKVSFDYFQYYCGHLWTHSIAKDIKCSYVRAKENSVLFVSALLHAESFPLFLPSGCTLGR